MPTAGPGAPLQALVPRRQELGTGKEHRKEHHPVLFMSAIL
jgi:hypothetical protein